MGLDTNILNDDSTRGMQCRWGEGRGGEGGEGQKKKKKKKEYILPVVNCEPAASLSALKL